MQQNVSQPSRFQPTVFARHTFRFRCTATLTSATAITRKALLDLMSTNVVAAGGANSYSRIFSAIRLREIRAWTDTPALGSAPSSISVEWAALYTPSNIIQCTSSGSNAGFIRTRPPKNSSCGWWSLVNQNETEGLFGISCTTGAIIEYDVDIMLVDDEGVTFAANTGAGVLGTVYGGYGDGYAAKKLLPLGLTPAP